MYTEEPRRRINWGNVFRKIVVIVLIVLIIFLIIWLINRGIKNNKIRKTYNNNTNINETNTNNNGNLSNPETYTESFITNYMYFHNSARDYIEKNSLPANNSSVKYTLQELINEGIILPTNYGDSKCNTTDSYVIVTNKDGKYEMTTTLICGKEIAKTSEELKCSELCTGCQKEVTKTEYEFKQEYKATETVYTCPSGYTKTGSGNNTKCVKNTTSTATPSKVTTYSCPNGYVKSTSGGTTICVKSTSETVDASKNTTYSCSKYGSAYKLSGTSCIKAGDTQPATPSYSCSVGTPNSNHMCPTTTISYTCSSGDLVNTRYCRIYTTGSYYVQYTSYYGKTYNGCSYSGSSTTPCTTCSGSTRTVYSYKCYKTTYTDVAATENINTIYNTPATVSYSCSKYNSEYKLSGSSCVKAGDTKAAVATTTYSCSKGTLSGTSCIIAASSTTKPSAYVSYVCPDGYTKEGIAAGATCTKGKVETVNPKKTTKTVKKYRTKWSTEKSLSGWTRTGKTRTVKAS